MAKKKTKKIKSKSLKKARKKIRKIERVSTGIKNLDKITEGGFENNSTNLLAGGSGSGKSIFGMQFLLDGIKKDEKCLYINFEEKKKNFYRNMYELGWDLQKLEKQGDFFFLSYTPEKVKRMLEEGGGEIENLVLTKKINRIVIDSITAFEMLFANEIDKREAALSLYSLLRKWNCTSLLTYEKNPAAKTESSGILEFESDSLIYLYYVRTKNKRKRYLEVFKMRGTKHSKNIFGYNIKEKKGISLKKKPYTGDMSGFRIK